MRHLTPKSLGPILLIGGLVLGPGCGSGKDDQWTKDRPQVNYTSGQVLLNGDPVADATVTFQPVDPSGKPGFAVTDEKGRFEVQTFEPGDGLTAGEHRVSIRKTEMVDAAGNVVEEVSDEGANLKEKHVLPEKYADFATSGIEVQIESGAENELEPFRLIGP